MSNTPAVTIAVPTRNRCSYLQRVLSTVLSQTRQDFVVRVADNASGDDTSDVLLEAAHDTRVTVHRHEALIPRVENYNFLLSNITTPFALVLADDDLLHPDFLARTLALLEADPKMTFAHAAVRLVGPAGETLDPCHSRVAVQENVVSGWSFLRWTLRSGLQAHQSTCVMRSSAIPEPAFDPRDGYADDIGLQLRLAAQGKVGYVDTPLADVRIHDMKGADESPPVDDPSQRLRLLRDQFELRARFLRESPFDLADSRILWRDARRWYAPRLVHHALEPLPLQPRLGLQRVVAVSRLHPRAWADATASRLRNRRPAYVPGIESPVASIAAAPIPRVAIIGRYGSVNLGNNGSLSCLVRALHTRVPEADLEAICHRPAGVDPTLPVTPRPMRPPRPTSRLFLTVNRMTAHAAGAAMELRAMLRFGGRFDALLIGGTGVVDDFGGATPAALLTPVALWSAATRLRGGRIEWVNVGAGPWESRTGRAVAVVAAELASRRSYRDFSSLEFMHTLGVKGRDDEVHPDVVFSLPPVAAHVQADHPSLAIAVMDYRGWRPGRDADQLRFRYLQALADLTVWASARGARITIIQADGYDGSALDDLESLLLRAPHASWSVRRFSAVEDLVSGLGYADIAVVTRYHALIAALLAGATPVSVSYTRKSDELLRVVGLEDACQPIDQVTGDRLIEQVARAWEERRERSLVARAAVDSLAKDLAGQMDALARRVVIGG